MTLDYDFFKDKDLNNFSDIRDILCVEQVTYKVVDPTSNVNITFSRINSAKKKFKLNINFVNGKITEIERIIYRDSQFGPFQSYEALLIDYYNDIIILKDGIDDNIKQDSKKLYDFMHPYPTYGTIVRDYSDYTSKWTYQNSKLISEERIYPNGNHERYSYEYQNDKLSRVIKKYNGKEYVDIAYEYDENGNEIFVQWIENYNSMEIRRGISRYDPFGNITFDDNYYNGRRIIRKYLYKYDSHNNWIERRIIIDNQLIEISIRDIQYIY